MVFIAERECLFLSSIIISTCSLLSYFSSPFIWDCCWHIRRWRGTRLLWSLWQTLAKNYFPIGSLRLALPDLSRNVLVTRLTRLMHTRCLPTHHGKVDFPPALSSSAISFVFCPRKEIHNPWCIRMVSKCNSDVPSPVATSSLPALLCHLSAYMYISQNSIHNRQVDKLYLYFIGTESIPAIFLRFWSGHLGLFFGSHCTGSHRCPHFLHS